jgi:hypothetical protein
MLNYLFGASIALALAGSCGGVLLFTQRQVIRYGAETGYYLVDMTHLPTPTQPVFVNDGAYAWLVSLDGGLAALSAFCPYCRATFRWAKSDQKFRCFNCPSEFTMDGTPLREFTPRSADRLQLQVNNIRGSWSTPSDGSPVSIEGAESIILNAKWWHRIFGKPNPLYVG